MVVKYQKGAGIDYSIGLIKEHPEWVKESNDLWMLVNIWTIDEPEDILGCIDNGVDFITTNRPELVAKMMAGNSAKIVPVKDKAKWKKQ